MDFSTIIIPNNQHTFHIPPFGLKKLILSFQWVRKDPLDLCYIPLSPDAYFYYELFYTC